MGTILLGGEEVHVLIADDAVDEENVHVFVRIVGEVGAEAQLPEERAQVVTGGQDPSAPGRGPGGAIGPDLRHHLPHPTVTRPPLHERGRSFGPGGTDHDGAGPDQLRDALGDGQSHPVPGRQQEDPVAHPGGEDDLSVLHPRLEEGAEVEVVDVNGLVIKVRRADQARKDG